ncbi:hypothetical protein QYE76_023317 [Lolium multiflorum]|uniref:Uncharacterized protein n=1 Tax=Lolium multiflorum TaxID=4521 RepID=A0AAD8RBF8_LOLMU|nr:hypothetical protein QYE76_023317 [Lolium multiflorum]
MLAMTGHAKKLSDLGIVIPNRLGINHVLQSLPPSYKNFVMNYNMQNMNKELPELFAMLKSAEIEIKKEHQVLMVNKTTSFKKQGKSKGKNKKSGKKAATPPVKPKAGPKPDAECYYCKEKGHWKRNCSKYLADLKSGLVKKKKEGMEHWTAVKNILKYLKRTKDMFLCYGGDQELVVTSYTDASWNTDPDDSKSQSGYVFILNGAAVSWASSKQCTVAKSSTESEYIAASEASSEAIMASPSINFNQFLEKEKLKSNGSNFTDWFRHVRIFLNGGNLQYVLDAPLGPTPPPVVSEEEKNVFEARAKVYSQVQCAILCSLEAELQKRFEHHDPCDMMRELKVIFETHAAVESYEASKQFFGCMMEEGSSVSEHMFAMSGHARKLSDLGIVIPNQLGIHRVLQSLPPSYKNFVMNYNMQNMNKELPELFSMLKSAEVEIQKEHQVLMVNKTTKFKKQGKPKKDLKKGGKKAAAHPEKPKGGPKPDTDCYYCNGKGHWKRNCSNAWVFDTGSVAHICNSKQELRNKRSLARDEVTMRVGNGSKVDVIAVGTLPLHLPSGLVLDLNNCYLVPALSMNIISGSCLMQDGYSFKSENNGCSIFMNNIFYGHAPEKNGLFLLNLDSSDTHVHNIDAKRIKLNDNSTYMWHYRLGHIGVKRMKKLHADGLLESLDFQSLDRCEACLMGKMTKTPFSGIMERATDLLEIIHTDVCGPMSVASRGGYRYVLTFTDDLSRYGYIYFMKHKSETFQKFKEFQSEVENQRNKKIKFLRSDRGGEYLSYEFGMHLKKCGILSQLTPPGTPQRNGVSERRNRTLLDMVRSMMSLTDLPLSFWGYALETAAFTLNRAPSKSVATTPYELWFNKKPKLSFLKVWGCEAYVKKLQPDKLEPKAEKCVFIGYPKETIGYTFYHRSEGKIFDPTYEEAMMSPDSNKWQEAMKSEMGSMYDNKVWTLVDLPDSRKAVENKWIFKRKTDADGNMDVKTAFLNGDIEEELYMVQPKGFVDPKNADMVFGRPKGLGHLFKEAKGHPKGTTSRSPSSPSRSTTLHPNPSYSLLLLLPQRLRRSPAGDLHHHRHHAVVLPGFRGGSTTSAARWNGEKDVVFINTERVTEYGGAARLWHRQDQDLLRAFASGK